MTALTEQQRAEVEAMIAEAFAKRERPRIVGDRRAETITGATDLDKLNAIAAIVSTCKRVGAPTPSDEHWRIRQKAAELAVADFGIGEPGRAIEVATAIARFIIGASTDDR